MQKAWNHLESIGFSMVLLCFCSELFCDAFPVPIERFSSNNNGYCRCAPAVWSAILNSTTYIFDFDGNTTVTYQDITIWDFDVFNQTFSSQVFGEEKILMQFYRQPNVSNTAVFPCTSQCIRWG